MASLIEDRVKEAVAEQLGLNVDEITAEMRLEKDLGADSLDLVELIIELEEEFDISISDAEADGIKTVGDAIVFIEDRCRIESRTEAVHK